MLEGQPLYVATMGIGYGKDDFTQSIIQHGIAQRIPVQEVDVLGFMNPAERAVVQSGYLLFSRVPSANIFARRIYGNKPRIKYNIDALAQVVPEGSTVITVSPIALDMFSNLPKRHVVHQLADRRVERADVNPRANRIVLPGNEVDDYDLVDAKRRVHTRGFPTPWELAQNRYLVLQRQRKSLEAGGLPHVLYTSNGAGTVNFPAVVAEVAPLIKEKKVTLSVFAGHRRWEIDRVFGSLKKYTLSYEIADEHRKPSDEVDVVVHVAPNRQSAASIRMKMLSEASVIIPDSPTEMVNVPIAVILDSRKARNDREKANARQAVAHGWGIDCLGKYRNAVLSLTQKHAVDAQTTTGVELMANAWQYNDPSAASRLLEIAQSG